MCFKLWGFLSAMFVTKRKGKRGKKTSWLTTWPFLLENEPTEGSSGHMHSSIFSYFIKNGFSVVSQQIFFRRKGIYLQINRPKNNKLKKKDTPTPVPTPSWRITESPSRRGISGNADDLYNDPHVSHYTDKESHVFHLRYNYRNKNLVKN